MFTQPVTGKMFFGRTEILEILTKRVNALTSGYRQNIALTGPMLSGKSSILHHFVSCLNNTSFIPIYVEVGDKSFPVFAEKFLATVIYAFLKGQSKTVIPDMNYLIDKGQTVIPRTVEKIKKIRQDIAKKRFNLAYRDLLEITSQLKEETHRPCVVILDEIHNLETYNIKNPFLHLGKIIMIQKNTMYIVSSSQRNTMKKILSEKLSLLFGNFEIIEVSGFEIQTAKNFLTEKIAPVSISEYYIDYLINLTRANPFYLDILARGINSTAQKWNMSRINVELLKEALSSEAYSPTGTLHQHFTNQIHFLLEKKTRKRYLDILLALARGANKLKDIPVLLCRNERKLSAKLDDLINQDLVFKSGVFYKIQDALFEFWLKNVYLRKEASLIDNISDASQEFGNFIESDIETYLIEYNKGLLERLRDLFKEFRGELIEIDRKLRRLPEFTKIEVLKYGGDKNYIACETPQKYWISKIMCTRTEETDVIDFIQRTGKKSTGAIRKILISLKGIAPNALLLAKEKHIWVWNLRSLNMLLGFYKKQELIL